MVSQITHGRKAGSKNLERKAKPQNLARETKP
jgi:hypothetical protein